ncbi:MAG: hypothetical protein IT480_18540 [Gammaproteobacteria bacterium]|nr:hypothetical protein [Gammaproteobacteria bacterium]
MMPSRNDPMHGLQGELDGLYEGLRKGVRVGTKDGAELIRRELLSGIKAIGRDRFGKTRGKAAITIKSKYNWSTVGRSAKSAGHWAMVDQGAKVHDIRGAFGRSGSVRHPGMKPTGVWDRALAAAAPSVDKAVADGIEQGITKEFGRG